MVYEYSGTAVCVVEEGERSRHSGDRVRGHGRSGLRHLITTPPGSSAKLVTVSGLARYAALSLAPTLALVKCGG